MNQVNEAFREKLSYELRARDPSQGAETQKMENVGDRIS